MTTRNSVTGRKSRDYSAEHRQYYSKPENRAKRSDQHKARKVGITVAELHRARERQDNRCAIDGKPLELGKVGGANAEHADHDHVTGKFRGLLCGDCNLSLGKFGDTLEGVQRVVEYLSPPADPDCF